MKVLHVIPSVSPIYGGPSLAIRPMIFALRKRGLQVDVATTTADGEKELNVPLGTPVDEGGVRYFYFPRQFPKWWTFSWPLTIWLSQNVGGYDLLHIHALFSYPTLSACHFARKAGVPYLLRPLGTMSSWSLSQKRVRKGIYYHLWERENLSKASAIHATSQFEAQYLEHLKLGPQIRVIPLGVEPADLLQRRISSNGVTKLLFLSRLNAEKGLSLLIESLAFLRKSEIRPHLTIAGNGNPQYLSQLKKEIRHLELSSQVEFVGFVEGEKKARLFNESDIFILPSNHENFGLAVAEAMAAGLPVVVSDQVGISAEIREYGAGLVVSCAPDSIARGLERLIKAPSLRTQMGIEGKRLVQEKFSWDKITSQLIELYQEILDG